MLTALVRNWWMMVARGALAIVFGLLLLLSPRMPFDRLLVLFGVYAILDGTWAIVAARRASPSLLGAWPIALGGAVSVGIGLLAIGWPFLPQRVVQLIVVWGLVVGGLEIIGALLTPRATARHWLLGSGGVWTLFLAVMVIALPHGDADVVVRTLGVYALVFGVIVVLVASVFRRDMGRGSAALT
jgi:uncharacterized membrane protein HdeD (DUF308 family)